MTAIINTKDVKATVNEAIEHISKARCRLLSREPFYGAFSMMFEYKYSQMLELDPQQRTMGVRFMDNGRVECIFNPDFVMSKSLEQMYGVLKHEIEHIIHLHPIRCGSTRHPLLWNYAVDMVVNGPRNDPRSVYQDCHTVVIPMEDMIWIPEGWEKDETSEYYYNKIPKTCPKCGGSVDGSGGGQGQGQGGGGQGQGGGQGGGRGQGQGDGDGDGKGGGGKGPGECKCGGHHYGQTVDNHEVWKSSTASEDEARQVVKDMVDQASSKSRGLVPGHLQEAIKDLAKPVVRWREVIRQFVGRHCGGHRMTYAKRNRRLDLFGQKGVSHHAVATLGVIIDTSGSIGSKELEQFFAEIEAIAYRTKTWLLQWDADFQGFTPRYRRGDWKKIKICGRGGTSMDKSVDYIMEEKIPATAVVMLTDGYTPWPNQTPFPMIFCITSDQKGPEWGTICRMPLK